MGKTPAFPPFLQQLLLTAEFIIAAAEVRIGMDTGPNGLLLLPGEFIIDQGLYVKIRYILSYDFHFFPEY